MRTGGLQLIWSYPKVEGICCPPVPEADRVYVFSGVLTVQKKKKAFGKFVGVCSGIL
jgi:hypothetical protein